MICVKWFYQHWETVLAVNLVGMLLAVEQPHANRIFPTTNADVEENK